MPEVVIPIGPQHPALKEPVNFRVIADGEKIVRLELDLSYNHRGIEKAAEQRNFIRVLPLLERVCGICSHSHATAFAKGIEEIMGLEIPPRARYIRTIIAELERMHSHLLWLGVAAHEIGFNTLFMWTWRDREAVQDTLEEMSGNRVHYNMNEIGGVRCDLTPAQVEAALRRLPDLEERIKKYRDMVNSEETMLIRFRGVGRMSKEEALKYGAVGPTARASGVDYDVRRDDPYLAYTEVPWNVITDNNGDVYGRTRVRIGELWESIQIVRSCLENMPGRTDPCRGTKKCAKRGDPLAVRGPAGGAGSLHPDERHGQGRTGRYPLADACELDLRGNVSCWPESCGYPGDCCGNRPLPFVLLPHGRDKPENRDTCTRYHAGGIYP